MYVLPCGWGVAVSPLGTCWPACEDDIFIIEEEVSWISYLIIIDWVKCQETTIMDWQKKSHELVVEKSWNLDVLDSDSHGLDMCRTKKFFEGWHISDVHCDVVVVVGVNYEAECRQGGWDGWQNVGWGMSNWTVPPPPPPSESHVSSNHCSCLPVSCWGMSNWTVPLPPSESCVSSLRCCLPMWCHCVFKRMLISRKPVTTMAACRVM